MGYSLFSVGERVLIVSGSFQGIEGTILPSASAAHTAGTVILQGESELLPVTMSAVIDGQAITVRVPPELLRRI
jgi:hypothetical protein